MHEQRLGSRYLLTDWLGGGGMGEVFSARSTDGSDEPIAVKLLRPELTGNPEVISRFLQESRLLRSIRHPNVVRVLDLVAEGDRFGIVMEYVPDGDLRRSVPLPCPASTALPLLAQVADGLAAIHSAGITHRDLKPENVLVERLPDGSVRARVTDFGVSHRIDSLSTWHGGFVGSAAYTSPEGAAGWSPGPPGDVYALGVMLYEMCTGRRPFVAESPAAVIRAHAETPAPRPEAMPDLLWELLSELLTKAPDRRPDAASVALRLRALARQGEVAAMTAGMPAGMSAQDPTRHVHSGPAAVGVDQDALTLLPGTVEAEPVPQRGQHPAGTNSFLEPVRTGRRASGRSVRARRGRPPSGPAHSGPPEPVRARRSRRVGILTSLTAVTTVLLVAVVVVASRRPEGPRSSGSDVLARQSGVPVGATPFATPTGTATSAVSPRPAPSRTRPPRTPSASPSRTPDPSPSNTPAFPVPAVPVLSLFQPDAGSMENSDQRASLSIDGVVAGAGTIASILVLYDGGNQPVAAFGTSPGPYRVTITGLQNGRAYTFAVRVCNSFGECSTSKALRFTPYTIPTLAGLRAARSGVRVTLSYPALILNGNPRSWVCRLTADTNPHDAGAPNQLAVPIGGGSSTWAAISARTYSAQEICNDGVTVVAGPVLPFTT